MTPIGPYTSKWTTKPWYIVSDWRNNQVVYVTVQNRTRQIRRYATRNSHRSQSNYVPKWIRIRE